MPGDRRRPRVVAVHVLGQPHRRADLNDGRERLLSRVVNHLTALSWGVIDAVLFPAGFFTLELALGPRAADERHAAIAGSEISFACRTAAERLWRATGALLVVGIDTRPYARGFKGDQMMFAWQGEDIVGSARKFFPSPLEVGSQQRRYPLFEHDFGDPERFVKLGCGDTAILCVCYDVFAFSERVVGPTWKTGNLRLADIRPGRREPIEGPNPTDLFKRFDQAVTEMAPTVALIAVHGFEQPGRETRWQRHGIASGSAGLGGGLSVGAAHFRWWLPDEEDPLHCTLASRGVGVRHLTLGLKRRARKHESASAAFVTVPGSPHLAAVLRLFEG